ncbi:hypothetical protein A0J61_06869 [Choanephora cucurbitarum]|uniref:Uncharacterized protein n=1 Tax=Choanephora cucurbitarum TaxID=101091 RepID=A0A1C7N7N9_9FUNG|nr:hypothetical protein A0J61_06869 [Choanephora cucurbitarum]
MGYIDNLWNNRSTKPVLPVCHWQALTTVCIKNPLSTSTETQANPKKYPPRSDYIPNEEYPQLRLSQVGNMAKDDT